MNINFTLRVPLFLNGHITTIGIHCIVLLALIIICTVAAILDQYIRYRAAVKASKNMIFYVYSNHVETNDDKHRRNK